MTTHCFFESHSGDEDPPLDGTIGLTMSFSELSSGTRQASTPWSRENAGYAEVPGLFRLDKQVDAEFSATRNGKLELSEIANL